jgi:hypothetical protein
MFSGCSGYGPMAPLYAPPAGAPTATLEIVSSNYGGVRPPELRTPGTLSSVYGDFRSMDQPRPFQAMGGESYSDFWAFDDALCTKGPGAARIAQFNWGMHTRVVTIEADRPITLRGQHVEWQQSGRAGSDVDCTALARGVPVRGKSYRFSHRGGNTADCQFRLVDTATGELPPEFQMVADADIAPSCRAGARPR